MDFKRYSDDDPVYTMEEVAQHATKENRIWVTYTDNVYDITDYADKHPGADIIMKDAGRSMDQSFMLYPFHKKYSILKPLEEFRIGSLKSEDKQKIAEQIMDPYINDPKHSPFLKAHCVKPYFAEPLPNKLIQHLITPTNLLFVRNHLPVPQINDNTYRLKVCGLGIEPEKIFSLDDIKNVFNKVSIIATMQCSGNRRTEMHKVKPVKGLLWEICGIANPVWSGVLLSDLLQHCGLKDTTKAKHVQFDGLDLDPRNIPYGASIPIEKAIDPKYAILLAYEVNGGPLPIDNGYPLRVITPGICGARCVKWLGRIIVSEEESSSFYQQVDYKGFAPSVTVCNVDYTTAPAIQELPVTSAICEPINGQTVRIQNGRLVVRGYAWSGGGRRIIRVDLSTDRGKEWKPIYHDARITTDWSWIVWETDIQIMKTTKQLEIWVKAIDSSYNSQPESLENIWNFGGVVVNAYHRIKINIRQ